MSSRGPAPCSPGQEADPLRRGFVADLASRAEVALELLREGAGLGELRLQGKVKGAWPDGLKGAWLTEAPPPKHHALK